MFYQIIWIRILPNYILWQSSKEIYRRLSSRRVSGGLLLCTRSISNPPKIVNIYKDVAVSLPFMDDFYNFDTRSIFWNSRGGYQPATTENRPRTIQRKVNWNSQLFSAIPPFNNGNLILGAPVGTPEYVQEIIKI